MKRHQVVLVPVLVLSLFVGTGVAAQTPPEEPAQTDQAGPPPDLPGPVPDFVGEILGSIQEFLDGVMEGNLGAEVSDIAGNGGSDAG